MHEKPQIWVSRQVDRRLFWRPMFQSSFESLPPKPIDLRSELDLFAQYSSKFSDKNFMSPESLSKLNIILNPIRFKARHLVSVLFLISGVNSFAHQFDNDQFVALQYGYGMLSSKLSGTGFNSDLPSQGNFFPGIEVSKRSDSKMSYSVNYEKFAVDLTPPSGLTPSSISIFREELKFMATTPMIGSGPFESLRLGLGYQFLKSGGTNTSPNNILTTQSSQGLVLKATYSTDHKTTQLFTYDFLIYLPHQIKESEQMTGYNPKYLGYELNVTVQRTLSENMVGFTGLCYQVDQASFDGAGTRGVSGGNDTRTFMTIPIGIKIGY